MDTASFFRLSRPLPLREGTAVVALALTAGIMACSDQDPTGTRPLSAPPAASAEASGPGSDGAIGTASSSQLWASVDIKGNLVHGSQVLSTTHLGIGRYEVT